MKMSLPTTTLLTMSNSEKSVLGLFAGVGGIELGLAEAGFTIRYANEIDPFAAQTYRLNFSHELIEGDISDLEAGHLADPIGLISGGFPCQPFSVAGYRRGFDDDRGNVFWEIDRLIRAKRPEVVFLENVKNLIGHDGGRTFATISAALSEAGYSVKHSVLNSSTHGNIPQNRERIYIVAFRSANSAKRFSFPDPIPLASTLSDFIDFKAEVDPKYFYSEKTPFFDELKRTVVRQDTVYQWRRKYVRENKSGLCPTLTANMGMGGHNVPIILSDAGIRKLTPRECFNLMGFRDIQLPNSMPDSRLYKQAGNAVVVPVIARIGQEIQRALQA